MTVLPIAKRIRVGFLVQTISQSTYHRLVAKQQPTSVDSATTRTATDIECNGENTELNDEHPRYADE